MKKTKIPRIPDTLFCALKYLFGTDNITEKCGMLKENPGYNCIQICYAFLYKGKRTENWENDISTMNKPDCPKDIINYNEPHFLTIGQCVR